MEPCPWEDVTQVFRLYEGYDNEKSTENKRKQLCKIIGRFVGCSIGFYTGTSFGKHDYNLIDVMNLSLVSKKLQNYILRKISISRQYSTFWNTKNVVNCRC